jgi:hypothetical protein
VFNLTDSIVVHNGDTVSFNGRQMISGSGIPAYNDEEDYSSDDLTSPDEDNFYDEYDDEYEEDG